MRKGAVFTSLSLADEISRTSSRIQATLLGVMKGGSVSMDGTTMTLEQPFPVIATQNPYGSTGTQQLPESQLNRFVIHLEIDYPQEHDEIEIPKHKQNPQSYHMQCVMQRTQILEVQKACREVFVRGFPYYYIIQLLQMTRNDQRTHRGTSPRAGVILLDTSKAYAPLQGRNYVVPEGIQNVFVDIITHCILMQPSHSIDAVVAKDALTQLLRHIQPSHAGRRRL